MNTIEKNDNKSVDFALVAAFVARLADDPFAQDAFMTDRAAVLARAGLSEDDLSRLAPEGDGFDLAKGDWASCQTCSDPGPDPFPEPEHDRSVR